MKRDKIMKTIDMDSDQSDASDDSDKELQAALAGGLIKPGLYMQKTVIKKEFIHNKEGLKEALKDTMQTNMPWVERLDLTVQPLAPPKPLMDQLGANPDDVSGEEVHNDFKREMLFYRQAQAACLEGLPRLQSLGIPTRRPDDYFAEMSKSDQHMKRIRQKLVAKQIATERSEKAKKIRELRKYGKKVQHEVLQTRQKEKKKMLDSVKKYRKGVGGDGLSFLEEGKARKGNPKRDYKNKKFGFGGQKKRSKHNRKTFRE